MFTVKYLNSIKLILINNISKSFISMQERPKSNAAANALKLIRWFTSNKYNDQSKNTTLKELNKQIKIILEQNIQQLIMFTKQPSLLCMRPLLVDTMSKYQIVSYFRYLLTSYQVCQTYKKLHIPLLISRILEKENKEASKNIQGKSKQNQNQIIQCLKFIKKWIEIQPKSIPKLLVNALIAITQLPIEQGKKDAINPEQKILGIQVIRKLSIANPQLCAWCGGISVLLQAVIDPALEDSSRQIVCTLLYLMNEPKIRNQIHVYLDLSKIFWIFTDIDYNPQRKVQTLKSKFQVQLDLGKKAIITILKSWVGLVYLGCEISILKSFIQSLRQKIRPEVRNAIYEVLESLLMIGNHSQIQKQNHSKLRIANLLNCYLITLVQLLIDCDLFKILVELSGLEQQEITFPAQKFLKQLTILMFNSLPNSSKYIDFLISAATQYDQASISLKSCSSFVINKIGNYVFDKKNKKQTIKLLSELQHLYTPSTLYIPLTQASLNQSSYALSLIPETQNQLKYKNLYESTSMVRQFKDKYQKWKWQALQQILKNPYDKMGRNRFQIQKQQQNKLIKYLLRFYTPSRKQFVSLQWNINNFKYIKVGQLLVKNILNIPSFISLINDPSHSQFEITVSFLDQLKQALMNLLNLTQQQKITQSFCKTLQRELICWIGLFSETKKGLEILLIENGFFELLEKSIEKPSCDYILSVLLYHLDYNKESSVRFVNNRQVLIGPREFLQKCLMKGSKQLVLQGIEVFKMLYKTEVIGFNVWGFKMFAKVLRFRQIKDQQLINNFMEAIEEIFQQQQNVSELIQYLSFGELDKIKQTLSPNFMIYLISSKKGLENVKQYLGSWLDEEYDRWMNNKNITYNERIEGNLNDALNFVEPRYEGYTLKQPNNQLEMLYIYKIPWVAKIDNDSYPLFVSQKKNNFYLQVQINKKVTKTITFSLMIGDMYVDQSLKYLTPEEESKSRKLEVNLQEKSMHGVKKQNNTIEFKKEGVVFIFLDRNDKAQTQILLKVRVQIRVRKTFENPYLPIHLIGELAKTESGCQYLRQKKTVEILIDKIKNKETSPLEIRACLWAIGHLGCTNQGMVLIKQNNILDYLINMSQSHNHISLRGTCRYILNMICSSSEGRKVITEKGWLTNRNSNIGWICVPSNSKQFFKIEFLENNYWTSKNMLWEEYNAQLQVLNQKQKKLLNNIALLSNTLSLKGAVSQIKDLIKQNPQLTNSAKVFKNVILLMIFYKFREQTRRYIYSLFDEYMKSNKFLSEIQNFKFYFI